MSNVGQFRVSFHVSHAELSADRVASLFQLKLNYSRSVGELRRTKQGKVLGGVYKRTDVSFFVTDGVLSAQDFLLEEYLGESLEKFPLDAVGEIVRTGGECFFLVGIFSEGNFMCNFDAGALARMASIGIGLKLDFYGGAEVL